MDKLIDPSSLLTFKEKDDKESKAESMANFRRELRSMLFGFGDVKNPHDQTLELLNSMAIEYITNVAKIGQSLDPNGKLSIEAIHSMTQNDPAKFEKIRELLKMQKELKNARKNFETSV